MNACVLCLGHSVFIFKVMCMLCISPRTSGIMADDSAQMEMKAIDWSNAITSHDIKR